MSLLKLFIMIIFLGSDSLAWEADNFTGRYIPLNDSTHVLNQHVNERLARATKIANLSIGCNKLALIESVHSQFMSFVLGRVEAFAEYSQNIDRFKPEFTDSIYQSPYPAPPALAASKICSSININGTRLGTDKLGHFFDQGYSLFTISRHSRKNTTTALKYGLALEDGIYGAPMTSIKSYADLVANYEGFLFWTNLIENENPYYTCEQGSWVQVRQFDWRNYVNHGWDEAINCSSFQSDEQAHIVKQNARKLEHADLLQGHIRRYQCPAKNKACKKLSLRYGQLQPELLGPGCL